MSNLKRALLVGLIMTSLAIVGLAYRDWERTPDPARAASGNEAKAYPGAANLSNDPNPSRASASEVENASLGVDYRLFLGCHRDPDLAAEYSSIYGGGYNSRLLANRLRSYGKGAYYECYYGGP